MTKNLFGVKVRVDPYIPIDSFYVLTPGTVPPLPRKPDENAEEFSERWLKHAVAHGAILMVNNLGVLEGKIQDG